MKVDLIGGSVVACSVREADVDVECEGVVQTPGLGSCDKYKLLERKGLELVPKRSFRGLSRLLT